MDKDESSKQLHFEKQQKKKLEVGRSYYEF